jgi:hypothetical protein
MSFFSQSQNKLKTWDNLKVISLIWCSIIFADAAAWPLVEVFSPFSTLSFFYQSHNKFKICNNLRVIFLFGALSSVLMLLPV